VLKLLAEKGDLNIVTGPGVTPGKVTIHLKDVPVEQAVNLVVRAAGLAYERIGNSILVAEPASLAGQETGLSSYTIQLKYADAAEIQVALSGLSEKIQVDRGGNRLIVVTVAARHRRDPGDRGDARPARAAGHARGAHRGSEHGRAQGTGHRLGPAEPAGLHVHRREPGRHLPRRSREPGTDHGGQAHLEHARHERHLEAQELRAPPRRRSACSSTCSSETATRA
jgi:hypothetical protein